MKKLLVLALALTAGFSSAFAQTQSNSVFIFTPSTQPVASNSTFQVTLSLQVGTTPSPVDAYDLWLSTDAANSGLFSITNVHYFGPYNGFGDITTAQPLNNTSDISSGYVRNAGFGNFNGDLGNFSQDTTQDATTGQTVTLATFTISTGVLNPNAAYTFYTTQFGNPATGGVAVSQNHFSDVLNTGGTAFPVAQSTFSISAVPEPATWSLIALSGLGAFGVSILRRTRRS